MTQPNIHPVTRNPAPTARTRCAGLLVLLLLTGALAPSASPQDKQRYEERSAARYAELFKSLDRDADGVVTKSEARGNLNFEPQFDDIDINRDGVVTAQELERFVEQRHGVRLTLAQQRP